MIVWVHRRGYDWAEWAARRQDVGLGYPGQSPYTRLTGGIRGRLFQGEYNANAAQFDDAVRSLQAGTRHVVHQEYLRRGTDVQKARALGLSRAGYYRQLHHAHVKLAETLRVAKVTG